MKLDSTSVLNIFNHAIHSENHSTTIQLSWLFIGSRALTYKPLLATFTITQK